MKLKFQGGIELLRKRVQACKIRGEWRYILLPVQSRNRRKSELVATHRDGSFPGWRKTEAGEALCSAGRSRSQSASSILSFVRLYARAAPVASEFGLVRRAKRSR